MRAWVDLRGTAKSTSVLLEELRSTPTYCPSMIKLHLRVPSLVRTTGVVGDRFVDETRIRWRGITTSQYKTIQATQSVAT